MVGRRTLLETLKLMCDWADAIIVMETDFVEQVPESYNDKTFVLDVAGYLVQFL